jgi:glycosyltransferase involved in cell wall biosynthesis
LARVPVVVHTPHGSVFSESFLSPVVQRAVTLAERAAGRWCDAIITKSESERAEYVRRGIAPAPKFVTLPSGIDFVRLDRPGPLREATRGSLGVEDGRPLILYAARFAPEKDHPTFLRAFARVVARRPDALAVLAGDGPLRGSVEEQAAALLPAGSVLSLGFREDVPDLMRAADVCVSASLTEGLPIMVGEALALARPVVATDAGGTREIVVDGETGLLVPCADPEALGEAVLRLLENGAQAMRLARAGRDLVRATLSLPHTLRQTEDLYEECLLRRRARP